MGGTTVLTAVARTEDKEPLSNAVFSFRTSDERVATVDQAGVVTGRREGSVILVATTGSVRAETKVNVEVKPELANEETALEAVTVELTMNEGKLVHFVIVELGGNDLLSGRDVSDFRRDLEARLDGLARPRRRLVVLELPLVPLKASYGAVQREVCRARGVPLLPRALLARIVSSPRFTVDGLHPSEAGHEWLATQMAARLRR